MDWERWGRRLLVGGLAIVTGAFARVAYDAKVLQIGRGFQKGARTERGGHFACAACGAGVTLRAGDAVPGCPACGRSQFTKIG